MSETNLQVALRKLPDNASEAIVSETFFAPYVLKALGFSQSDGEIIPEFPTERGSS